MNVDARTAAADGTRPAASAKTKDYAVEEIRRLSSLLDISKALSGTLQLKASLHNVVEVLADNPDAVCAQVLLVQEDGSLHIEAADSPGRYRGTGDAAVSQATARRVVETGRPVVIPRLGADVLDRRKRAEALRRPATLICAPVVHQRKAIGAVSVELIYRRERDLERAGKYYGVVASMIGQALKIQQLIEDDRRRLETENSVLRHELRERYDFSTIIGNSAAVRSMYEQVAQVASTNTTVLIRGESGTGKELIAHAIHYNSLRAARPFVKVSCAALPETLIESELFGYERGAFTDAQARKKGRFELAEGGTLFLDEIGDIDLGTQIKLLRVLQQREFERLGGTETLRANVRIVAATNRELEAALAEGTFREDLYYRLNVFTIFVPPLRDRKADLPLLAEHFLAKLSQAHGKTIARVSPAALDALTSYHWPGNVRELENVLERAFLVSDGEVLHAHHLPPTLQTAETSGESLRPSFCEAVSNYERDLIHDALKTARGNRAKAARLLNTTERILNRRVRNLAIDYRRFKV